MYSRYDFRNRNLANLFKLLTLLITFQQWVLELWYFTWVSLMTRPFRWYNFLPSDLEFDLLFENIHLINDFLTVYARALILHMSISSDNLSLGTNLCDTDLGVCSIFENVNLVFNFWKVSARASILHTSIYCDKTFRGTNMFFFMARSFYWYQDICPCDLGHLWNWPVSGAYEFHKHILLCSYINCSIDLNE